MYSNWGSCLQAPRCKRERQKRKQQARKLLGSFKDTRVLGSTRATIRDL